ncbi:MAG: HAD hydrolase-like protein [Deltaproteobacteria bacterium]|nr:HAD hydrolase-like protein [Deltaproteobacteria bacterium]
MNHPYLILFDYDGVIVDSLDVFANAFLASCHASGFDGITSQDQFTALLDGNFYESLKQYGLSKKRISAILGERFTRELQNSIHAIALFKGVKSMLTSLAARHKLIVVTSNVAHVVQQFFEREKITCFESVLGAEVEKSKVRKIQKAMSRHRERPAFYVGDTRGDIIEGRQAGTVTVAAAWGWHSKAKLAETNPDYMVDTPADLVKLFENI